MDKAKNESFFNKIKKIKHIEWIIAIVAVGLMLVLYFTSLPSAVKSPQNGDESASSQDYCIKMERKILECLSSMKGAGETHVVINWSSSVESITTAYSPKQLANSPITTAYSQKQLANSPITTAYSQKQLANSQIDSANKSLAAQSAVVQKTNTQNGVKLIYPKALAVLIVCEGGGDVKLRLSMMNVVSILLGIDPNNVVVCGM